MKYSIHNTKFEDVSSKTEGYIKFIKERHRNSEMDHPEDSINVPFDSGALQDVMHFVADAKTEKLKHVFVIGIGGSSLGPKALYSALKTTETIESLWIESVDEKALKKAKLIIESLSEKEELAIVISSKSGKTTETLVNAGNILTFFQEKFEHIYDRVAVVTDKESPLDVWADVHNIQAFYIPKEVGGRFSVFTPIGTLPLLLLGYDIKDIIRGAQEAVENFSQDKFAAESAMAIYAAYKAGKDILGTFLFRPEYENIGKWYRQLIAESLGKERNIENKTVNTGITPQVLIGSTDLHSMGQLYVGGPKDKFTMFVSHQNDCCMKIEKHSISKSIEYVHDKKIEAVNSAILEGVNQVYKEQNYPFLKVEFEENEMRELGYFMQSLMLQTMLLGHLMNVNTFNQPNVESYKKITKDILNREL